MIFVTIYNKPLDYPEHIVAREWDIIAEGQPVPKYGATLFETVNEAREYVKKEYPGKIALTRDPFDDPYIVETWV